MFLNELTETRNLSNWANPKSQISRENFKKSEKGAGIKIYNIRKFVLFFALFAIATMTMGQVKVDSQGKVTLGRLWGSGVKSMGDVLFTKWDSGWENINVNWNNPYGAAQIYCTTENFIIGTPDYYVGTGYIRNLRLKSNPIISSDINIKQNIGSIESPLQKLMLVNGKSYNYIDDSEDLRITPLKEKIMKPTFGFIAQDLINIFPELVYEPDELNVYYGVDYIAMIPILVEAIKEQQSQIELLQEQIDRCCQIDSENVTTRNISESNNIGNNDLETAKLYQNIPNPFSVNTEIQFDIPENTNSARLIIHDMQGSEIKSYTITTKGAGNITIQGAELQAGMYMYTLLIDNSIVDTKRMILTK